MLSSCKPSPPSTVSRGLSSDPVSKAEDDQWDSAWDSEESKAVETPRLQSAKALTAQRDVSAVPATFAKMVGLAPALCPAWEHLRGDLHSIK